MALQLLRIQFVYTDTLLRVRHGGVCLIDCRAGFCTTWGKWQTSRRWRILLVFRGSV